MTSEHTAPDAAPSGGTGSAGDARDAFIYTVAPGCSFCDVGGLWGTVKEKVSVALAAGASDITMVDVVPIGHELWRRFEERLAERGIDGCRCVSASIDDPTIVDKVGTFDVVHCSGVLYHCPNPLLTLSRLRSITRRWLILTSSVVPETIESEHGRLTVEQGEMFLVPALGESTRAILADHFGNLGTGRPLGLDQPLDRWDLNDYGPWWWLYTAATLRRMTSAAGFEVVADTPLWGGRSHGILAEVI